MSNYQKYPEYYRQYSRKWRSNHTGYYKEYNKERSAIPKEIRTKIRELLGGKCCRCNSLQHLEIHHLDEHKGHNYSYVELPDLSSLMLLCRSCHKKLHWKGKVPWNKGRKTK